MAQTHERVTDNNVDGPWWMRAVYKYGVMPTIVGYVVYKLLAGVPSAADVADVKALLNTHVVGTEVTLIQIKSLMQQICFNGAKDERAERACAVQSGVR